MDKPGFHRAPTVNRIIVTILASVALVFALMIVFVLNFLFAQSIERAKAVDMDDAYLITLSLRDNLEYTARMMNLTKASFEALAFQSRPEAAIDMADHILKSVAVKIRACRPIIGDDTGNANIGIPPGKVED